MLPVYHETDTEKSVAWFSPDNQYRFVLQRRWDEYKSMVNFLMLNPSTADAFKNDPTVERCQRRAKEMGFGGLIVTNLFAFRSTDPKGLYKAKDPIGMENDVAILTSAGECTLVVCGWGGHGKYLNRGAKVLDMLNTAKIKSWALRLTKSGQPGHPLYVPYECKPFELR